MSESRPRIPPIIDLPSLEPRRRRRVSQLINLAGWIVYVYLLTPAFGLLGWILGVELFAGHVLDDPYATVLAVRVYTLVILVAAGIFLGWAGYNWARFRGVDRRRAPQPITNTALERHFRLLPAKLSALQGARVATLHHDAEARIAAVEIDSPASPGAREASPTAETRAFTPATDERRATEGRR
ncbi:poly-beta-1,6-N-acetyl-D-glucosamine biosynthesis protein PgaD [Arhodomonas sp. SL1]|uniref:poly-beta-1,6-N-acetyl-D-glucosamine biosynthesis protein PgaD n=1 Tax=Arhodomonas sp. SL1 TaxID=3425691 RepID=UPI003F885D93